MSMTLRRWTTVRDEDNHFLSDSHLHTWSLVVTLFLNLLDLQADFSERAQYDPSYAIYYHKISAYSISEVEN